MKELEPYAENAEGIRMQEVEKGPSGGEETWEEGIKMKSPRQEEGILERKRKEAIREVIVVVGTSRTIYKNWRYLDKDKGVGKYSVTKGINSSLKYYRPRAWGCSRRRVTDFELRSGGAWQLTTPLGG